MQCAKEHGREVRPLDALAQLNRTAFPRRKDDINFRPLLFRFEASPVSQPPRYKAGPAEALPGRHSLKLKHLAKGKPEMRREFVGQTQLGRSAARICGLRTLQARPESAWQFNHQR